MIAKKFRNRNREKFQLCINNLFTEGYIHTILVCCKIKTLDVCGEMAKLQIWETASQGRFKL